MPDIAIVVQWLNLLRWPLTVVLLALGAYFWLRAPERPEPWQPPARPPEPTAETEPQPAAGPTPDREAGDLAEPAAGEGGPS